jgi:uncharacterized protein (UPF0128 family)
LIYQSLSEAKQEGKIKRKLYTKIILERAKNYLAPYLKSAKEKNGSIEISEEESRRIEIELLREKDMFENRKIKNAVGNKEEVEENV